MNDDKPICGACEFWTHRPYTKSFQPVDLPFLALLPIPVGVCAKRFNQFRWFNQNCEQFKLWEEK